MVQFFKIKFYALLWDLSFQFQLNWLNCLDVRSNFIGCSCLYLMHLSFVSLAPRYPGNGKALVVIVWGICACWHSCQRGTCTGLWPGIWAWTSSGMSRGMGTGDFVSDSASKMPYPVLRGSRRIFAGDLSASKGRVWAPSQQKPRYPGARDANDRCITV